MCEPLGEPTSRRTMLGAMAASAAAAVAVPVLGAEPAAAATMTGSVPSGAGLTVTLLGTNGGPPPLATRYGISSALTVNGRTHVIDCGRGAVTQ
ncbi:hypothetical protein OHT59_43250 [Streptomyces sp. NBC_00243]|uniref:hypothetical protein n=1 Tax=Streptomyces sp. NBC_00243 TaxID=2975688 RepID=UPI002DD80ED9|nr:hypothetical protein [Streptomyces sp. NBC_00243]WRZ24863.1 hypothetical protein OHT59_43250 [Streptomyces sp. NBC_00243]